MKVLISQVGDTNWLKNWFFHIHQALGLDSVYKSTCGTGSATTSKELYKFFLSLDIRLHEAYGSTESLATQMQCLPLPKQCKVGTVGKVVSYAEAKLHDMNEKGEGEICTRGRCTAMGYLFEREKTLETFDDDGWLHTGDLGTVDEEGFYSIVGRMKEIIITSGGENIAPVNIENKIKEALEDLVSNVMIVGEKKPYLSCLITMKVKPDPETLAPTNQLEDATRDWIQGVTGLKLDTVPQVTDLLKSDNEAGSKLIREIDNGIEEANRMAISRAATVKKWSLLPREFSVADGELSPTLKLKRFAVHDIHKDIIDDMYKN